MEPGTDARNPLHPRFWEQAPARRQQILAELRASPEPAYFVKRQSFGRPDVGFYLLARYADVVEASRTPQVFSSSPNASSLNDAPEELRRSIPSMINMDDPRHARMRRIVSRAFTPRMIKSVERDVATIAARIVDRMLDRGPCDFVTEVATPMPLEIICAMMSIPGELWPLVVKHTETFLTVTDLEHDLPSEAVREAVAFFDEVMSELSARRRAHPRDDLVTRLVTADVEGETLTQKELGSFFRLLVVAGNETTRNGLSHALVLLTEHEEQRRRLLADLPGRLPAAVEEVMRYASPVTYMRRTLTRDHELGGVRYRKGDKVILHYPSANRDETVFDRPQVFDTGRTPNPHLAFGGPGPHFCLGAHLARREMTVLLGELFRRAPKLRATAEPVTDPSGLINAVKHLPCAF
jgi:cytochrome P450